MLRSIVSWFLRTAGALTALLLIAIGGVALLPKAFGLDPVIVISGSMEPKMPLGSVVLTERVPVDHVAEGDIVSFRSEGAETNTMHRVVEVETRGGTPVLTTKGDANVTIDPEKVTLDSPSVPVVRRVIPYAGTLVDHLRSPLGGVALFLLPIGGLLIDKPARKRDRTAKRRPGGSSHSLAGVSRLEELAVREATVDALLLQNKELLARVELVIARIERVERAPGRRLVSWVGRWTVRGA